MIGDEEFAQLRASLAERGQQTPVEVLRVGGKYGLISGYRRVLALRELDATHVLALVRAPESAAAAYQAMVEENEVRADLSFFERAHIAMTSADAGVYPTPRAAVAALFAHSPSAKPVENSPVRDDLRRIGPGAQFSGGDPRKAGAGAGRRHRGRQGSGPRIADALRKTPPADAAAERRVLERALRVPKEKAPAAAELAPGVRLQAKEGRAVLSGAGVDQAFLAALQDWVAKR